MNPIVIVINLVLMLFTPHSNWRNTYRPCPDNEIHVLAMPSNTWMCTLPEETTHVPLQAVPRPD